MKRLRFTSTRSGVASLYVVIFATILFGVITLSFVRIILSEAEQSSNDDLSQSAYDSALAGVEDAKIAINRYFDCLNTKGSASACESLNVFTNDTNCEDGFPLAQILHNISSGEVKIQESSNSTTDTAADQAYTCVIISDVTPDYRGTLTADTRTKVVPVGINATGAAGNSTLGQVAKIRFSWYSELNQGNNTNQTNFTLHDDTKLHDASKATVPPTMQLTFIKTGASINLNDFRSEDNTASVVDSTLVFVPSKIGNAIATIDHNTLLAAGNATKSASNITNQPFEVECTSSREFACIAELDVSNILSNGDSAFLVVSLPYGDSFTDFSIALLDASGEPIDFKGVQISVDSTGRTNQLYRRVETRLDPADLFFPYPEYALEVDGTDDKSILKNFWITSNCWTERGACANNGQL